MDFVLQKKCYLGGGEILRNVYGSSYLYNTWELIIKRFLFGSQSIKWRIAERRLDREEIQ